MTSEAARDRIAEAAREILDAQNDIELSKALRAMRAVIEWTKTYRIAGVDFTV